MIFLKRMIKSSEELSLDLLEALGDIMKDPAGRKLYGKLHNVDASELSGYLDGIMDALEATGKEIKGFDKLYNASLESSPEYLMKVLRSSLGTTE